MRSRKAAITRHRRRYRRCREHDAQAHRVAQVRGRLRSQVSLCLPGLPRVRRHVQANGAQEAQDEPLDHRQGHAVAQEAVSKAGTGPTNAASAQALDPG